MVEETADTSKKRFRLPRITRDGMIFALGVLGVLHETLIREVERPNLLILFATMMGLPAFLRADELKKNGKQSDHA